MMNKLLDFQWLRNSSFIIHHSSFIIYLVMRHHTKYLFCLTAILLLASSFTHKTAPTGAHPKGQEAKAAIPSGGAWVLFAGKLGGEITRPEIEGETELKVEGCARGSRVFDFTLSITKNGKTNVLTTNSNLLTAEMRAQLKSLAKGDAFEFRKTKAFLPNGKDVVDVRGGKFMVV